MHLKLIRFCITLTWRKQRNPPSTSQPAVIATREMYWDARNMLFSGCSLVAQTLPHSGEHKPAGTCFLPKERATTTQLLVNQTRRHTATRAATHHICRIGPGEG